MSMPEWVRLRGDRAGIKDGAKVSGFGTWLAEQTLKGWRSTFVGADPKI